MRSNICFGTYLDFIRFHHGNLLKSLVTEQGDLLYFTDPH